MGAHTGPNALSLEIMRGKRLPELLCPAGSYRALEAAIEGGADAIYMGGSAFNARINAKNFTHDEMKRGIELAHAYGAKVYITANTLIHKRELDDFLRAAEDAYLCGADALIVADIGAALEIKRRIPIELHASTQLSGHGADAARLLADAGFSRMVCAREMSCEDIRAFTESSPLEAEVFVHGALCVCHSGQCLFSSLVGGRSGNRGECAQPCRLPYGISGGKKGYPLSLKDLCLAQHVPELCGLGIASLKIEGRMKSPEYVLGVTRIWRTLLDERRAATREEMAQLDALFSRNGFTDGYFTKKIDRSMLGVRTDEQKQVSRASHTFGKIERKLEVDIFASIKAEKPASLTVRRVDNGVSARVCGDIPQAARTTPIDEATVSRSILKLGDTPFVARRVEIELEGGLMLPVSSLNALRRSAMAQLCECEQRAPLGNVTSAPKTVCSGKRTPLRTAMFYDPAAVTERAKAYFDIIYLPLERFDGRCRGVALPPVIFDSERSQVRALLERAVKSGATDVLVGNIGHLSLLEGLDLKLHGDIRLNVYNTSSAAYFESLGFCDVMISPELTLPQMRDVGGASVACVYGRIPLMVTEKCVGKEIADCRTCESGRAVLTDRRGARFPVLREFQHRSVIFNSVPVYMADKLDVVERHGLVMQHSIFTVESAAEVDKIITAYQKRLPTTAEKTRVKS